MTNPYIRAAQIQHSRDALAGKGFTPIAGTAYRRSARPRIPRMRFRRCEGTDPKGIRMAYVPRPIIKSTHAQAIRRSGLRLARYRGPCKNTFQHVLTAAAINMAVMDSDFFQIRGRDLYCANTVGEIPLSCQFSPFAAYHFRGSRREHTLMEPQNRDPYKSTQDPGARNLHQKIASERK